jgi:hypothetical protein
MAAKKSYINFFTIFVWDNDELRINFDWIPNVPTQALQHPCHKREANVFFVFIFAVQLPRFDVCEQFFHNWVD